MLHFKKIRRLIREFLQNKFPLLYWTKLSCYRNSFVVYGNSLIAISSQSSFLLKKSARLIINASWFSGKKRRYVSEFRLDDYSTLICEDKFSLYQGASVYVAPNAKLVLKGGGGYLNTNATLNCFKYIEIGRDCGISDNVTICDSDNHTIDDCESRVSQPIVIKNHVLIGRGAIVLKGVTINENSVVAAGSVVTKDVPANVIVAGNPAIVIREIKTWR